MRNILICFMLFWFAYNANASNCTILSHNISAIITTKAGSSCLEFGGLNYSEYYPSADMSILNNVIYGLKIKNTNGRRLLDTAQAITGLITNLKLKTNFHSITKLYLNPLVYGTHYEYLVINVEDSSKEDQAMYIALNSKYQKFHKDQYIPCPT